MDAVIEPNPLADAFYNRVAVRFSQLTSDQQNRVRQRTRVKALIHPSIYLMALDSAIDLELAGAPAPTPCPEHTPFGRRPDPTCVVHPPGPLAENPKWK